MSEELKKEWGSKIGELVGEASMCWSELPGGVFESERAKRIVDDIMLILAKQQEEFVKMVGGLKYQPYDSTVDPFRQDGYSACIADIKSKLKK